MKFLNVSADPSLLHLRGSYLEALGFAVVNARNVASAIAALRFGERFDLAVLCHTLPDRHKLEFESFTRRTGAPPTLLELYLAEPPVTSGTGLDATTEFLPLVASWAQSLEETDAAQVAPWGGRESSLHRGFLEKTAQFPSSQAVH